MLGNREARRGISGIATRTKVGRAITAVSIFLLVVGAGYAFTLLNLSFWPAFAAMSAGVGLPEELAKAAAGMLILYVIFDTQHVPKVEFRRFILVAFGVAGLGFGAVESLKYFGAYAAENADLFWYVVRATWCVTLHGAWTLIVGGLLIRALPRNAGAIAHKRSAMCEQVVSAALPTAIVHGLYNAACFQGGLLPWVVGGLSLIVAAMVVANASNARLRFFLPFQQPT